MERNEIEAELNEVERDLADIARQAHIAASNLRSVMESGTSKSFTLALETIEFSLKRCETFALTSKDNLAWARARTQSKFCPKVSAEKQKQKEVAR